MPSSAHEVVVVQQHVLKALCDQGARRLALVVNVFDETAHLDFLSLGLQLNRFGCVNVTTVDVLKTKLRKDPHLRLGWTWLGTHSW